MNRLLRAIAVVVLVDLLFLWAVVFFASSCIVEAPELDCPGGLYCACEADADCDGYGAQTLLERGTCARGLCTYACIDDDECGDGICGPLDVRGTPVCNMPCDDLGAPCDLEGVDATCIAIVGDDAARVCEAP